ncbi:MAG: Gldg family protein [Christensenellaceae bacterium]|jgi:hypothetical protein
MDQRNRAQMSAPYRNGLTVFMLFVIIFICNLVLPSLQDKFSLQADLSAGKVYTLSAATKESLSSLEKDVYLFSVGQPEQDDAVIHEIIHQFTLQTPHLQVKTFSDDVEAAVRTNQPTLLLNTPGILISNQDYSLTKFISLADLYGTDASQSRFSAIKAEGKIISAVEGIARDGAFAKIQLLTGHGETSSSDVSIFLQSLEPKGYEIVSYTWGEKHNVLNAKTDVLLVIAPKADLSEGEYAELLNFCNEGGKLLIFMDYTYLDEEDTIVSISEALPHFSALQEVFGITAEENILLSNDPAEINLRSTSLLVKPTSALFQQFSLESHTLQRLVFSEVSALTLHNLPFVKNYPLVQTGAACYTRPLSALDQLKYTKEDMLQSYIVGALGEKENAKCIVFGDASFLSNENYVLGNHSALLEACVDYLSPATTTVNVPSKALYGKPGHVSGILKLVIAVVFLAVLPICFLLIALRIQRKREKV